MIQFWIAAAAALLAQAETPPPAGAPIDAPAPVGADAAVIPYPAEFFAQARPNNAFEMIQRLPGFTFDEGAEVRGFAGSAGNVLIDGKRPTSKAVPLEDLLKRMPAASVERIDLIRGGAVGIDMQGLPIVANIVRSRAASTTTTLTAGAKGLYADGWIAPVAALEWSRRAGGLTLEGAVRAEWERDDEQGVGARSRFFPDGTLRETGRYFVRERGPVVRANGSAVLERELDRFSLNAGLERTWDNGPEEVDRFDAAGRHLGALRVREERTETLAEFGADYERLLASGLTGRLVGLQTLGWQDSDDRSTDPGGSEQSLAQEKTRESILRATLTAVTSDELTLEGGAEGAWNVLDAQTAVTENGAPVVLPNANVKVEEMRGEAFALARWQPTAALSVEAGTRFEASRISQTGDTNLARRFFFPKPRLLVAWAPDADSQIRLRIEREVDQLDFANFVASADFGSGVVTAGGADLEPERAWVVEAALERRFWSRGAVVLTLYHAEVQQVIDHILVGDRFDAIGNIGDGRRDRIILTATLPLDRLGVPGGLISGRAEWRWSKVVDPVTGERRRISNDSPFDEGEIRFSQDVARLRSTWGVDVSFGQTQTEWRIDEIRRMSRDGFWSAYWDWKPSADLSVRASVSDVLSRERRRYRIRYDGPRSVASVSEVEVQKHSYKPFFGLVVRKVL